MLKHGTFDSGVILSDHLSTLSDFGSKGTYYVILSRKLGTLDTNQLFRDVKVIVGTYECD